MPAANSSVVMDSDVEAAIYHVSRLLELPWLIAAWIREYRKFETAVKLDDMVTPGIRRTRSVPQGDLRAADLFGAALDRLAM